MIRHCVDAPTIELLHVTAHLGGGVGKVLSRLVEESMRRRDGVRHVIACLERPEKAKFVDHVAACGGELLICPSMEEITRRAAAADIVQLEWWHHPVVAGWLCGGALPPTRLMVWSHVSGLCPPEIPPAFVAAPHRFLFSSPCSLEHPALAALSPYNRRHVDCVFSSGGFDDLPDPPARQHDKPLRIGYLGTLNFSKLHPELLTYLRAVQLPDFRLTLVGDSAAGLELLEQARTAGLADRLELKGYQADVADVLSDFDVLAYLLNPCHYGTTENALLEAMAMGVVPVVLGNPAERLLVRHGETGLIVDGPQGFAAALRWLWDHPDERRRLSANAAQITRERFSVAHTSDALMQHYRAMLAEGKRRFDFRPIFGPEPADWFRACQGAESWRFSDDGGSGSSTRKGPHFLYEPTKSSVFHYRDVYPQDVRLERWARQLGGAR